MSSSDGFPKIGAEITIQGNGVLVGNEKLDKPAGVGIVSRAKWKDDVVEVVFDDNKYYYYVSFSKFFTASEKMKLQRARDIAEDYRDSLNGGGDNDDDSDDSSDTNGWKIFFKVLFFPFKLIWKLLTFLSH